jgi:Domain of Unknown Function (DUF1080)
MIVRRNPTSADESVPKMLLNLPLNRIARFSQRTRSFIFASLILSLFAWQHLGLVSAQETKTLESKSKSGEKKEKDKDGWVSLLPERGLEGWEITDFYGHGEVKRNGDLLTFTPGKPLTGINYKKEFPKEHFEIEMEARRVKGNDFLCGLTFPVGKGFCSFIGGGWGGGLVGLSSIDGSDASENSTSSNIDFKNGQWYKFRVIVDKEFVRGWVDDKEIFAQEREGHEFSTRIEVYASQPLGQCVFQSEVEVKNFRWRPLDPETGKPKSK